MAPDLTNNYVPAIHFTRTDAERSDQLLSWKRRDDAFFAAGACHILAFEFVERSEGFSVVYLRPMHSDTGHHVYATNGTWAFDFGGWTREEVLLAETARACWQIEPDWAFELIAVAESLEAFCRRYEHRLPEQYANDPTERARNYMKMLNPPARIGNGLPATLDGGRSPSECLPEGQASMMSFPG